MVRRWSNAISDLHKQRQGNPLERDAVPCPASIERQAATAMARVDCRSRRDFLAQLAMAGGAAALGFPGSLLAKPSSGAGPQANSHVDDWRWLVGNWDVRHRRLKERLVGSHAWEEFTGKSAMWLTMGGLGTIDDNAMSLPGDSYRGLSIRAFDAVERRWSIWWLDGRNPSRIDPPVRGAFEGSTGTFIGRDELRGRPITMRFRWRDIHGPRPWWEQAFSADEGAHWEVNWLNYFTRTSAEPTPLPALPGANRDWDFLVGRWNVHHRRLRHRLVGSQDWDEFDGTLVNWPVLGGQGNVGDNVMPFPTGTVRGMGIRAWDPAARQWLSWWLDGRLPTDIAPPLRGGFADGVGTFVGDDTQDGRPITTRVLWSRITRNSARWEQAGSLDGGTTWESNWFSDFTRVA